MLPEAPFVPRSIFSISSRGVARLVASLSAAAAAGGVGVATLVPHALTRSAASPRPAATAPAQAPGDTQVVFGPRVFATPNGNTTTYVERFAVAVQPTRRYTLTLVNGAADGTQRATGGSLILNGKVLFFGATFTSGAPLGQVVEVLAEDTIQVTVQGPAGAFVTVSIFADPDPTFTVFAERFTRNGPPATDTRTFALPAGAAPAYYLHLVNGNPDGTSRMVTGSIVLNGVLVATNGDINERVGGVVIAVTLQAQNTFQLGARANPSGFLDVRFAATDTTRPVLTITSPAPGLITRDTLVTVAGSVQDQTPTTVTVNEQVATRNGASYSATVPLAVEGSNLLTVRATDAAGLSTDSTRTVIRDTQAPVLTVTAPADGMITNQMSVTVSGTVTDATPVTVNANGVPLPVDGAGAFTGQLTLAEGANIVTVAATDAAGNQAPLVVRMVTLDTQAPVIAWAEPADGATVTTETVAISGTVTDATAVTLTANGAAIPVAQDGSFSGTVSLALGPNTITLVATDGATNASTQARTVTRQSGGPPDPVTVATPVNRAEVTTIGDATAFLYSGDNPIQTGVAPGTINPVRAAVVRGRVLDRAFQPLAGATVTILGHPELGQTQSRQDGGYDLAVNGGGPLTVSFAKPGYFPAQRPADVAWQDYTTLGDVVLVQPDTAVMVVDLTSPAPPVARGSVVSDADGPRQATVIFKPGNQATLTLPDGTQQSLTTLTIRATEFTVGDSGRLSMPAVLPPASQYTYAVQISADEQLAAGPGATVTLAQPVPFYVENFLEVPVGTKVPVGSYAAATGTWTPEPNGIVLRVVGTDANGRALIDITGDGQADPPSALAALGIDDYELVQLAGTYPAGSDLWRALAPPRFEPLDLNYPFILVGTAPTEGQVRAGCSSREGDPLRCQLQVQTAFQSVGIVGSPFTLNYASDRTQGNVADRQLEITLTGPTLQPQLVRVELEVDVAGQRFRGSFAPQPNLTYTFTWDGTDLYGRLVQGTQPATVLIGYVFPVQYSAPANAVNAFGLPCAPSGSGTLCPVIANAVTGARAERTLVQRIETSIGTLDATALGLGGFTLDAQHVYDPVGQVLYNGDGSRRAAAALPAGIRTIGGTGGSPGNFQGAPDSVPATSQQLRPTYVAVGPDGTVYFDDRGFLLRKIAPDGLLHTLLGNPALGGGVSAGDGGPARQARVTTILALALGPDGSIYLTDAQRVRRIDPSGIINTVAGTGTAGFSGDSGPATAARLSNPRGLAVGPDGSVYIADQSNLRIRRIGPDGIITTVAGGAGFCGPAIAIATDAQFNSLCGNGIVATKARLAGPVDVKLGLDGSLFISDPGLNRVRRVGPDGIIRTFAGSATTTLGDGGLATLAALFNPWGLAVGLDGSVYITPGSGFSTDPVFRIRRVAPTGIITTAVGTGFLIGNNNTPGWAGDGGPAPAAQIGAVRGIAAGPDGNLYFGDNFRIRKVAGFLPGFGAGQTAIASEDGSELYVFSAAGRILLTLDAVTRDTIYKFAYNEARQLVSITDQDARVTQIERDAAGKLVAIIAPNGQRTEATLDANGQIAGLIGPDGFPVAFGLDSTGMLKASVAQSGDTVSVNVYDAEGRLASIRNALGGTATYDRRTFDGGSDVVVRTASGRSVTISQVELPAGGFQLTTRLNGGMTEQTTIDLSGRIIITGFNGTVTTYTETPDPRFGMQAPRVEEVVRLPSGLTRTRQVWRSVTLSDQNDPLSLIVQLDSLIVNGRVTTVRVDNQENTITRTSPVGRVVLHQRDSRGRITRTTVPGRPDVTSTFDALGRLSNTAIGGRTSSFSYNLFDHLTSLTDEMGLTSTFGSDANGRVTDLRLPDGSVVILEYDENGYPASVTPAGKPPHELTYNTAGLLARYTAPDAGDGPAVVASLYDGEGRLVSLKRPDNSIVSIAYDSTSSSRIMSLPSGDTVRVVVDSTTGRLMGSTITSGASYSNQYDGGLLTGTTWSGPVQGNLTYTYDADFRVQSRQLNSGSAVQLGYDADGLLTSVGQLTLVRNPGNGTLTSATIGSLQTLYAHTPGPELSEIRTMLGSDTVFAARVQRDSMGRIAMRTERIGGVTSVSTFAYDSAGRLALVTRDGLPSESYEYDDNGNRIRATTINGTVAGVVDAQERLVSYGANQYRYTLNGERRLKIVGFDTTTYTYDAIGNLRAVEMSDGTVIDYVVDGDGRRVGKKVNGVLVRAWLYDGPLTIAAELDEAGQVVSRFVYGINANVPEYMVRAGNTYRFVTDERRSVRLIVDVATGTIVQRLDYDAYGRVTANSNPDFQPMGFAGGLYDQQTGLVRFGARDYDAETGAWTNKDPLAFEGGDANLYAYASDDPVNRTDITGLMTVAELPTLTTMQGTLRSSQAASAGTALQAVRTVVTIPGVTAGPAISQWAASVLVWGGLLAVVIEAAEDVRCDIYEKCIKAWEDERDWCFENMPRHKLRQCLEGVNERLKLCVKEAPEPWPAPFTDPPWLVP